MKPVILCFFLCLITFIAFSQDTVNLKREALKGKTFTDRPPQAVFSELGGSSIVLSVNYDRRFNKTTTGLGFRAGIGYSFDPYTPFISLPVGINYLLGKRNSFFETGIGETPIFIGNLREYGGISIGNTDYEGKDILLVTTLTMGYRLQPAKGGFNLRAGFTPLFARGVTVVLPYVSLGYNF